MFPDARSGIVNDPNRDCDPQYIVRLAGQVATVSVETVRLGKNRRGCRSTRADFFGGAGGR